ncbi:transmembrane protein 192-like [Paramacrobiotus metropolitanus]|uniref:transmembrane protein 192-like n=1 Tax=Paramacrobiotus metropolitanus TaxID=2943436 RepID=UPI0024462D22|nr:transmembrane protein 192-like [Paramacrobiotus metropolitanus]XP_055334463.1 transmembrane protein 192-like [Paramacrobiotus metropolitanus]XP_055334464.1 transmembrane protein 192-like [Paramacrobiotus metropolitanus]
MVSLGRDTTYISNLTERTADRMADVDTAQLITEADEVAFWDMAGSSNGFSSGLIQGDDGETRFHPIRNIPLIIAAIICVIANAMFSFIFPEICSDRCRGITAFDMIAYLQISVFAVMLGIDIWLRKVHLTSRNWGYLEFYRRTRMIRRLPFISTTLGLASFLLVTILTDELCQDKIHCVKNFTRANAAQLVCCLEVAAIIPICAFYLLISYRFNKARDTPDVLQEDLSTERILQTSINHGSQVGFKDHTFKEDLLEKQSDEILYLKKRNAYLSSRLLLLTRQLNSAGELSAV